MTTLSGIRPEITFPKVNDLVKLLEVLITSVNARGDRETPPVVAYFDLVKAETKEIKKRTSYTLGRLCAETG